MNDILISIIVILNLSYLYFWLVVFYARLHRHVDESKPDIRKIAALVKRARNRNEPYLFIIQITTKGGSIEVVKRGIAHALKAIKIFPVLKLLVSIEVVTEAAEEAAFINHTYSHADIPVTAYLLPKDYRTPHGTKLKARALHYMVELHRLDPKPAYVLHYDEESVLTATNLIRLVINLLRTPVGISEGMISYGLDWMQADLICRAMESNRPFGCHECYLMMTHPVPLHLHGSNLVIQERLENEIGWDIGLYKGNALIAEDLVFGLVAYQKYGKSVFGWHGVEMIEQPPFTLKAARKQRERWILGALQGLEYVKSLRGWRSMSLWDKFKIQWIIRFRIFTYAVGFPVSVVSVSTTILSVASQSLYWSMTGYIHPQLTVLAIPGLCMWIGSTQLGLYQNLRYADMTWYERIQEHIRVLTVTPFAGLFDTIGPFVAVCKWTCGVRGVAWVPTPKNPGQEYKADVPVPETVAV